jgi:hypothetical protein
MKTTKLIVTVRKRLQEKYGEDGFESIQSAINSLAEADNARGIETVLVYLDDEVTTAPYSVSPIKGQATPLRCKRAIDALYKALSPDYVVILGADDVIPYFKVPNPSFRPVQGDDDEVVPTDNPYACSRPFSAKKAESYLIPDRVLGRIPDLPGKNPDLSWLLDYLNVARSWKSSAASDYDKDLMVCCDTWRKSGEAVASYLSRAAEQLMIAPPSLYNNTSTPPILSGSYGHRFHVIKCHGAPLDTMFYGQEGQQYPPVLTSNALSGKTVAGTVVGAMCCYGAALFDPNDPRVHAENTGDAPIPSVYLRQGAHGFVGSTTIAWVGVQTMLCADWIIASFMRYGMEGASTGRALLDAKQEFVRWINQQGRSPDIADEKTLLQFHLLGDPSIHPVTAQGEVAAESEGDPATATAAVASLAFERRRRRSFRRAMGVELRKTLPTRELINGQTSAGEEAPQLTDAAQHAWHDAFAGLNEGFNVDERPLVHKVVCTVPQADLGSSEAVAAAGFGGTATVASVAVGETFQYYWTARKKTEHVVDARMVKVETNREGEVLRTQVLTTA